jgi:hypothetical protein
MNTLTAKLIVVVVVCVCTTVLGLFDSLSPEACIGLISAAMGYFFGRFSNSAK